MLLNELKVQNVTQRFHCSDYVFQKKNGNFQNANDQHSKRNPLSTPLSSLPSCARHKIKVYRKVWKPKNSQVCNQELLRTSKRVSRADVFGYRRKIPWQKVRKQSSFCNFVTEGILENWCFWNTLIYRKKYWFTLLCTLLGRAWNS